MPPGIWPQAVMATQRLKVPCTTCMPPRTFFIRTRFRHRRLLQNHRCQRHAHLAYHRAYQRRMEIRLSPGTEKRPPRCLCRHQGRQAAFANLYLGRYYLVERATGIVIPVDFNGQYYLSGKYPLLNKKLEPPAAMPPSPATVRSTPTMSTAISIPLLPRVAP